MNKKINILTQKEEKKLSNEALINYYKSLREYYSKLPINIPGIKIREIMHNNLLSIMKTKNNINVMVLNKENLPKTEKPVIYAVNHTNSHDIPTVSEVIGRHHYVLLGKQSLKFIDRIAFRLNGVIYVNRKSKKSKLNSKNKMIKYLINGKNILMFPEGTWNTTPNLAILPLNWGIVDIAKIASVPIVPITLEYDDHSNCYATIGEQIYIDVNDDKKEAIDKLRDTMSSMRWEFWSEFNNDTRKNVSRVEFDNKIKNYLAEYPKLDYKFEQSFVRKEYDTEEEVFAPVKKLIKNEKNYFLFNE